MTDTTDNEEQQADDNTAEDDARCKPTSTSGHSDADSQAERNRDDESPS